MATYNTPNTGMQTPMMNNYGQQQIPVQFPYGNNNMLLNGAPYNNYMGNRVQVSQTQLSNQYLKCRPVSSKEEARAYQIDLDGSLWVFTDVGNGKIYTKQINNDGTAAFKTYGFIEDQNSSGSSQYVTKEEFKRVTQTLMAAIQPLSGQQAASANSNDNINGKNTLISF